ncbi:MAG TPA: DUF3617 family protein [Dongiaceae bacterium]|nr:DUF3617 family protein [Dongiaceae bacterium]
MVQARSRRPVAAFGTLLFVAAALPAGAADPAPAAKGDFWEVTTQMSMPGMPMQMPAQKTKVCAPKEWKEPPAAPDTERKCTYSDFKVTGPKATWKVVCAGPPPMTGDGEITRNGDAAWSGALKFAAEQMNMTIKLDGKRLGDCDLKK